MNTRQSPYDDIITRHLLDKFDKSIMAEMLAECLAPAGPETPMKMFIVRVDGLMATQILMSVKMERPDQCPARHISHSSTVQAFIRETLER